MNYLILNKSTKVLIGKSDSLCKAKKFMTAECGDAFILPNYADLILISSQYRWIGYGRYKLLSEVRFNGENAVFSVETNDTEFIDRIKRGEFPEYEKAIFGYVMFEKRPDVDDWMMSMDDGECNASYHLDADGVAIIK